MKEIKGFDININKKNYNIENDIIYKNNNNNTKPNINNIKSVGNANLTESSYITEKFYKSPKTDSKKSLNFLFIPKKIGLLFSKRQKKIDSELGVMTTTGTIENKKFNISLSTEENAINNKGKFIKEKFECNDQISTLLINLDMIDNLKEALTERININKSSDEDDTVVDSRIIGSSLKTMYDNEDIVKNIIQKIKKLISTKKNLFDVMTNEKKKLLIIK